MRSSLWKGARGWGLGARGRKTYPTAAALSVFAKSRRLVIVGPSLVPDPYSSFRFIASTAYAAARAVSPMYVMDGFWHAVDAMQAPSVTNTFFTSWHWLWAFKTDVFGSRPMRAVPISWIVRPGGLSSTNVWMSRAPAASSISAPVTDL